MIASENDAAYLDGLNTCHTEWASACGNDRNWLNVEGVQAQSFLQRLLTSDITALAEGKGQWSALLNRKGQWIADLLVFRLHESTFIIDHPAICSEGILSTLEKAHFEEDVRWTLEDWQRTLILGPKNTAALAQFQANMSPPPSELTIAPFCDEGWILGRPDMGAPCLEICTPRDNTSELKDNLHALQKISVGPLVLEALRISSFIPRFGKEFSSETILPETGEWRRTSQSKGCYVGQEVVARVRTYGESPWKICGLEFESTHPLEGMRLTDSEDKEIGHVTSWALSPKHEKSTGLGRIRRKAARKDNRIFAMRKDEKITTRVEPLSRT